MTNHPWQVSIAKQCRQTRIVFTELQFQASLMLLLLITLNPILAIAFSRWSLSLLANQQDKRLRNHLRFEPNAISFASANTTQYQFKVSQRQRRSYARKLFLNTTCICNVCLLPKQHQTQIHRHLITDPTHVVFALTHIFFFSVRFTRYSCGYHHVYIFHRRISFVSIHDHRCALRSTNSSSMFDVYWLRRGTHFIESYKLHTHDVYINF